MRGFDSPLGLTITMGSNRRYKIDETFLSCWSSKMAYVLGFWFADGYMRKEKSYRIAFSSKDKSSLVGIKKALGSDHPIRSSKERGIDCWEIILFSKRLYSCLTELGGDSKQKPCGEVSQCAHGISCGLCTGVF